MNSIYCIVLAAGESSRFGSAKQLATVDGVPMVRRAVETADAAFPGRNLLVLGANWRDVLSASAPLPGFVVRNEAFADGIGTSIASGIQRLPEDASAAVVLLADQPLVNAYHLISLAERWNEDHQKIVVTDYTDQMGPPVLFPAEFFAELSALTGDRGARDLIEANTERVIAVRCPAAGIDIDEPADLNKL